MVNGMIIIDKPKYIYILILQPISTYTLTWFIMVYLLRATGVYISFFTPLFSDCRIWMLGSAIQIGHGHGP